MPFAHLLYRNLRSSSLAPSQRRRRFLLLSLLYTSLFLLPGLIFLILLLLKLHQLNQFSCSICSQYNTIYSCGWQQCCDNPDGLNSCYYNSYMYCLDDYRQMVYFIVMICMVGYGEYQLAMICCIMRCNSQMRNDREEEVVVQNRWDQRYIRMMGYQGKQQEYAAGDNYTGEHYNRNQYSHEYTNNLDQQAQLQLYTQQQLYSQQKQGYSYLYPSSCCYSHEPIQTCPKTSQQRQLNPDNIMILNIPNLPYSAIYLSSNHTYNTPKYLSVLITFYIAQMFTFFMLRMLGRRPYSYQQRRFRFFMIATIYISLFLIAGFVFLGLYLSDNDDFDETPMIICFVYAGIEILMVLICLIGGRGLRRPGDDVIVVEGQVPLTDNYGRPYPNGAGRRGRGMPPANPNYQGADYTYTNNMNNNTNWTNNNNANNRKPQAKPSQPSQTQPQQNIAPSMSNDATPVLFNGNPYIQQVIVQQP